MSRKSIMSEGLKHEIAREMGISDLVASEGWGAVSARDCGRMVHVAIEIAERAIAAR